MPSIPSHCFLFVQQLHLQLASVLVPRLIDNAASFRFPFLWSPDLDGPPATLRPVFQIVPLIAPLTGLVLFLALLSLVVPLLLDQLSLVSPPIELSLRSKYLAHHFCLRAASVGLFQTRVQSLILKLQTAASASSSILMSVDSRLSRTCLRFPARVENISRSQLSSVHTGDLTRPAENS
ncbi:hypothetical protein L228DRAFT_105000 [Xylona heveae TC161]|uniref:Uncharacterized protein n=1 Tax=Xylona heveae (strain CBS 132557 / TC161) TaxID=1328760 RepID=A0A165H8I0_XYLHT|nr:hypothetical protein L228DRAFT_105000 [Xylona heveae TC161]KZF23133.1 hypothetical protein L228DRAFT_105000 [Xylona heveae TC161]